MGFLSLVHLPLRHSQYVHPRSSIVLRRGEQGRLIRYEKCFFRNHVTDNLVVDNGRKGPFFDALDLAPEKKR